VAVAGAQSCGVVTIWPERLYLLCDAVSTFPEPMSQAFPGSARSGPWVLHSHCYLVLAAARTILVDTGIGPRDGPAGQWLGVGGRLPELLGEFGLDTTTVTSVVLTHLHLDHIGWNVDSARVPMFANAEYLVQEAELRHAQDAGTSTYHGLVAPVLDAGQLRSVTEAQPLGAGLRLMLTPGHTPGHQSLIFESDGRTALLAGDAFVHPMQVEDPDVEYAYEWDGRVAAATRRQLLSTRVRLQPAHF
jgi:glyoxylase-like metal-dependent hydrolase (beta-lactamase superfamily II)